MPQVSVIIPTCNRPEFLRAALQSVARQSFQDFEIVVVDAGDNDNSRAVVESIETPSIRYLRHEGSNSAAARNSGILHSKGEYVAFLDDDDEWYPEKLMNQMRALTMSGSEIGAVYTGSFRIDRRTQKIVAQRVPTARGDLRAELLNGNCIGGVSSVLMRRECFDRIGRFDERLSSFEDYDLWLRMSRIYHFECLRAPLVKSFVHPDRISSSPDLVARGLELMLRKHGGSRPFRRTCSDLYLRLGLDCCETKRVSAGRKAFLKAWRLNPTTLSPYAYLGVALAGGSFQTALRIRATLLSRVTREIHGFAESM